MYGIQSHSLIGFLRCFAALQYLTSKQQLKSSQYLVTAQGGTEATQGSATLKR